MAALLLIATSLAARADALPDWAWWPEQAMPKGLLYAPGKMFDRKGPGEPVRTQTILVESLAGLAAQGVNEGRSDELVWIDTKHAAYAQWLNDFKARTKVEDRGSFSPWDLTARLITKGVVKGYILYTLDTSTGKDIGKDRKTHDESLNAATTAAGVLGGILITADMEEKAKSLGLSLLLDARDKTASWVFSEYKEKLNKHYLLLQDSRLPQNRDMAIAHRMTTLYTLDDPMPQVLKWMEPIGTVFGWYQESEDKSVGMVSKAGHVMIAADFTNNLPVLSAGRASLTLPLPATSVVDAAKVEKEAAGNCVSFMLSDGDNVQWMIGDFQFATRFWTNPDRDKIPFGWTTCPGDLDLLAPDVLLRMWNTKPANSCFIAHAGYFYPDLFAEDFYPEHRTALLHQLAKRIGGMMDTTNIHLLTFLCMKLDTPEAKQAYQIFAHDIPGLVAVFPIKFDPYEGGGGEVFWENDGKGGEVPFITAQYALWAEVSHRTHGGSPTKIAQLMNAEAKEATAAKKPLVAWTIIHAWSGFAPSDTSVEDKVPNYRGEDALRGVSLALNCSQKLDPGITVVNPEELAWIVRWQHDSEKTKALLQNQK